MLICKEAIKMMSRKKKGRIINIGSMAIKHEVEGEALYTSTKSALLSYSRVLAKEVHKSNITVNVVSPSIIKTDLSSQIDPVAIENILQRNAIQGYGKFEDLSNVIDFLISENSFTITGQHIYLGGV
jgi:3-oxoacyl-[acyl-carrier protein] reductase